MFGDVTFAQAPFASLGGNTFPVSVAETAAAQAAATQVVTRGGLQDESSVAQASLLVQANMAASQAETATASAAQTNIANMLASLIEQASASGAQTNIATMLASMSESASADDFAAASGNVFAAISEAATGADSSNRGLLVFVAVQESAGASATFAVERFAAATVAEAVSALNTLGVIKTLNVRPNGVQLTINIGTTLIWVEVNDTQAPNWVNIPS